MDFTHATEGSWTLGVLIGGPVLLLTLLALTVGGIWLIRFNERVGEIDRGIPLVGGCICLLAAFAFAGIAASPAGYYPYDAEYHQWREVSGEVTKIDKRLIGSGDSMEDKFVVRFDGSALQFGCDDTRCAQVVEGDALTLSCKRAWQYTGTDGYDCRFVSTEAAS